MVVVYEHDTRFYRSTLLNLWVAFNAIPCELNARRNFIAARTRTVNPKCRRRYGNFGKRENFSHLLAQGQIQLRVSFIHFSIYKSIFDFVCLPKSGKSNNRHWGSRACGRKDRYYQQISSIHEWQKSHHARKRNPPQENKPALILALLFITFIRSLRFVLYNRKGRTNDDKIKTNNKTWRILQDIQSYQSKQFWVLSNFLGQKKTNQNEKRVNKEIDF